MFKVKKQVFANLGQTTFLNLFSKGEKGRDWNMSPSSCKNEFKVVVIVMGEGKLIEEQ